MTEKPAWLLKFARKDLDVRRGLLLGRQKRLREKLVSRAGDWLDAGGFRWLDAGGFRLLGRFTGVSRAMR